MELVLHQSPPRTGSGPRRCLIAEYEPGSYAVGTFGQYVVVFVRRSLGSSGVASLERATADVAHEHGRVGHLVVLYPEHTAPGPLEREAISHVVKGFRHAIAGAAIVREGDGFKATMTRGVVSAINLMSRASHPTGVFADVGDASVWLASHLPTTVDAVDLRAAVRELRARF